MTGGVTLLVNLGTKKVSYATTQLGVIFPDNGSGSIDNKKSYENVAFLNKNHPIILWCVRSIGLDGTCFILWNFVESF